jgi:TRAP-type mannitol/chloroaromatic compound transport system substrate-binding protein
MRRRDFLAGAVIGGAGLAACGGGEPGPAVHAARRVQWRMASSFPRSLDTIFGAAEVMAARVSALTDGLFEIHTYPSGELVPGLEVLDAVQQGTVQLGQTGSYYYIGKNPALAFDTCVPFGLTARQQAAWLEEAGGRALVDELFADFGIKTFAAGNTGVQMGGWFKPEVRALADLKGLKMRIPGMGGKAMEALGVVTQTISGGEIYPALERGAIDATDWVGPYDDEKLGFYKVAKNYYYPGWWEPGPSLSFYVNQAAWAALPKVYQEALASACIEATVVMQARYDANNPGAMKRLLANGVNLAPFPDDLMRGAREASAQLLEDNAASSPAFRKIYDAWKTFRADSFAWFATAELSYQAFAFPNP